MELTADISFEDPGWDEDKLSAWAARAFEATLAHLGLGQGAWEIAVLACSDDRIAELNGTFRGKARPTNVLSWPAEDRAPDMAGGQPRLPDPQASNDPELGDIAIAFQTCRAESEAAAKPFEQHVTHLLVHALLHLLGFDHETDEDAALMEGLETDILASLGHPDPYMNE